MLNILKGLFKQAILPAGEKNCPELWQRGEERGCNKEHPEGGRMSPRRPSAFAGWAQQCRHSSPAASLRVEQPGAGPHAFGPRPTNDRGSREPSPPFTLRGEACSDAGAVDRRSRGSRATSPGRGGGRRGRGARGGAGGRAQRTRGRVGPARCRLRPSHPALRPPGSRSNRGRRRDGPHHVCEHEAEVRPVSAREEPHDRPLGQAGGQDRREPELHRARWVRGCRGVPGPGSSRCTSSGTAEGRGLGGGRGADRRGGPASSGTELAARKGQRPRRRGWGRWAVPAARWQSARAAGSGERPALTCLSPRPSAVS